METQAVALEATVPPAEMSAGSAGASLRVETARSSIGPWFVPAIVVVVGGGSGAAGWYFGGTVGLAIASLLTVLSAAGLAYGWAMRSGRQTAELWRFVASLNQANELNTASFGLGACEPVARQILRSQASLVQQLRDRQSSTQKLEFSLRLAQTAQRRAEAIVHGLRDAVLVTNPFGDVLLANREAERLFQFQADAVRGKPLRETVAAPEITRVVESFISRGVSHQRHAEEVGASVGGKSQWFQMTMARVADAAGEPLGIATVLRDISEEKAAKARAAEFVSAVSHEVKTPLASVKAYAEMLADGDAEGDPEIQQKFLGIIQTQTDRMTRLLEGMLDIARIESGVVRIDKKVMSLNELIEGGVKLMTPQAADKEQTIDSRLSPLALGVAIDPDMMSRVVMNLISNAIKYTDRGGCITVRSRMASDHAVFEVADTGRGIPADALPKLFQKFYRVKENSHVAPGTGLGLSLVKHIIEEVHGGTIEVESEVGKGSVFRVKLPLDGISAAARN
jgi:two-component system phosphate regulon sensor histidine kinase PhoR